MKAQIHVCMYDCKTEGYRYYPVTASQIFEAPNLPGIKFAVHHVPGFDHETHEFTTFGGWQVSDVATGTYIGVYEHTRKAAMESALQRVARLEVNDVQAAIAKHLEKYPMPA